jgi:hypothetical protein
MPPAGGPFMFGGPGILGGLFGAVHGTVVVPKSGGGYQTTPTAPASRWPPHNNPVREHSSCGPMGTPMRLEKYFAQEWQDPCGVHDHSLRYSAWRGPIDGAAHFH